METTEGVTVNESAPIAQFAIDYAGPNQGLKLWPHENTGPGDVNSSVETVKHKLQMLKFDKIMNCFWAPMAHKYKDEATLNTLKERLPQLEQFVIENLKGKNFLGGTDEPMYIDIHCLGYPERLMFLQDSCWNEAFEKLEIAETLKETKAWVDRMHSHTLLKQYVTRKEYFHSQFGIMNESPVKVGLSIGYMDQTDKR